MQQSSKLRGMMIDIETLDTKSSAVVIQIGAVVFDYDQFGEYAVLDEFIVFLPVMEQVREGRTISADTVAFWMSRDNHVMLSNIIVEGHEGKVTLKDWESFLSSHKCDRYWFQGPTFDAIILEDLMKSVPWKYFQVRDQRTVDDLAIDKQAIKDFKAVINHDALADCNNQLKRLMFCLRERRPAVAPETAREFLPSGTLVSDQFDMNATMGSDGMTGGSP